MVIATTKLSVGWRAHPRGGVQVVKALHVAQGCTMPFFRDMLT